jgi:biopolymer transport protein ExbD
MVDVAFQLVLFFLVTASTLLYKTLEVPPPNKDQPEQNAQQSARTLTDLQNDYILVEIDTAGQIKVDHEPVTPEALAAKLQSARRETPRTSMLLVADFGTMHRNAVLAYDAANEIGLKIALARPRGEVAAPKGAPVK